MSTATGVALIPGAQLGFDQSQGIPGPVGGHGSADSYVRTAVRTALQVTENLQVAATTHARLAFNGGPNFFGEDEILKAFEQHLLEQGLGEAHAKEATERLRTADCRKDPTVALNPQRAVRAIPAPAGI